MAKGVEQDLLSILIVDDHRLFVDGLARLLETLGRPVDLTKCHSAAQAIYQFENNKFDLLIIDLLMPGIDGLGLLKAKTERGVTTPVAVISSTENVDIINRAMKQGATGFIPKSVSSDTMLAAIETILRGDLYLPDELWERIDILNSKDLDSPVADEASQIGDRQLEVLTLMAQGNTNKQISAVLAIGETTVKYHISDSWGKKSHQLYQ